jgi:hypothetical protein
MSVFTPFTVYKVAFPFLKPGYIIKVADKYYMVITARENRVKISISGAQTSKVALYLTTLAPYEQLHGELKKNRIVHIQYLGLDQSATVNLYWETEPLLSKDYDDTIDLTRAGIANTVGVDRWSYDSSMYLSIKQSGTQNYYFEIMEYEVTPYEGEPDRPYLQIMANGQAIMVESPNTEKTLRLLNRIG